MQYDAEEDESGMLTGCVSLPGTVVLLFFGRVYALGSDVVQPAVGAWMPPIVTVVTAAAIAVLGSRRQMVA